MKEHKDDSVEWENLTYMKRLNVDCDTMAKEWMENIKTREKAPKPTAVVFCSEKWAIFHNGIKLTANMKKIMQPSFYEKATQEYLMKKCNWSPNTFATIDWPAIKTVFNKTHMTKKVKNTKLMQSWIPVG